MIRMRMRRWISPLPPLSFGLPHPPLKSINGSRPLLRDLLPSLLLHYTALSLSLLSPVSFVPQLIPLHDIGLLDSSLSLHNDHLPFYPEAIPVRPALPPFLFLSRPCSSASIACTIPRLTTPRLYYLPSTFLKRNEFCNHMGVRVLMIRGGGKGPNKGRRP